MSWGGSTESSDDTDTRKTITFRGVSVRDSHRHRVSEIHLALPPAQTEGKPMAGDPKEFRQRALRCTRLAKEAPGAETRQAFVDLAWRWDRLAAELENAQALLKTERDGA